MLDIQIAVAKVNKYATRESGDTVEVVERPQGGFSVVLADGQGSGKASKAISHLVTAKVVSLIKDGARDGVLEAGRRNDKTLDLAEVMGSIFNPDHFPANASEVAEALLAAAMTIDGGRPHDDMSVMVLSALEVAETPQIRRMVVSVPVE